MSRRIGPQMVENDETTIRMRWYLTELGRFPNWVELRQLRGEPGQPRIRRRATS